jgi:hypothetical protein
VSKVVTVMIGPVVVAVVAGLILRFGFGIGGPSSATTPSASATFTTPTTDTSNSTTSQRPTTSTRAPTTTSVATAPPGCSLTITFPYVQMVSAPGGDPIPSSGETVPEGTYHPLSTRVSSWANEPVRWWEISFQGRTGWFAQEGPILTASPACPSS